MGKKKIDKMEEAKAGLCIPPKLAAEMMAVLEEGGAHPAVVDGAAVVLGFLTTPEENPRHGQGFEEYAADFLLKGGDRG